MRTSTEISSISKFVGNERAVELVAKAGFDGWDFSLLDMWIPNSKEVKYVFSDSPVAQDNYLEHARRLRRIGEECGIVCNQSHAPAPCFAEHYNFTEKFLKRAIECTAEAGGEICVIHPSCYDTVEINTEMYLKLLPFAKEHNVKIATENMWGWNRELDCASPLACSTHVSFKEQMDALVDDYFVACLDLGHAEMNGLGTSAVQLIHALDSRLRALHIHDIDLKHDNHEIPFSLKMDFDAITKALREIGYDGWFTLEACQYLKSHGFDESNILSGLVDLYNSAAKFERMVKGE